MLKRMYRFYGLGSVRPAMRHGKVIRLGVMSLRALPRRGSDNSRAAVVVSRKVSKKAVVRNRIRRRIYECLRENWLLIKTPLDIVVIVHDESIATIPSMELKRVLLGGIDRIQKNL